MNILGRLFVVSRFWKGIDEHYSIHDFRMVPGKNHTNLIFDVLIPANDQISHQILKNKISAEVKQISDEYHCVIEIDHAFV